MQRSNKLIRAESHWLDEAPTPKSRAEVNFAKGSSVYLREAGLGARLSRKVNDAAYHAFSRIGNNVNQLAHIANATGELPDEVRLRAVLAEVLSLRSLL